MARRLFLFVNFIFLVAFGSIKTFAEDSETEISQWILAAMEFDYEKSKSDDATLNAVAENLPSLILTQIAEDSTRLIAERELYFKALDKLKTERLSLFLELSSAEKTRDAIILQNSSASTIRKNLKTQNEKIEEIRKNIEENLLETTKLNLGEDESNDKNGLFSFFKIGKGKSAVKNESTFGNIQLYSDDPSVLFTPPAESELNSYAFEKAVTSAKINGLLSGSITSYGDYAAVTVELRSYPGGALEASVTEVGILSQPLVISRNIARAMRHYLTKSPPITLNIELEPAELKNQVTLNFDGIIFPDFPETIVSDSGIHSFTIEAEGYRRLSVAYSFDKNPSYSIKFKLQEKNPEKINFKLDNPMLGTFMTYGIESTAFTPELSEAEVLIDGKPVIAQFISEEGNSTFFYFPQDIKVSESGVTGKAFDYDISENIEKRRRRMYTAYTALILSLPFTFYYYGNYIDSLNGNGFGSVPADDVNKWLNKAMVCTGISVSLGVVAVYQLIRYLHSTDDVLPRKVKK